MSEAAVSPALDGLGDDDLFGTADAAPPVPDFKKMKAAELNAFYDAKPEEMIDAVGWQGMKVAEKRAWLKEQFPDPNSLTTPDVTGFDPDDKIHEMISEIQALEVESTAIEWVKNLLEEREKNRFILGGVLSEMKTRKWHGEFDDFFEFAEATFGLKKRATLNYCSVFENLTKAGIAWSQVQEIGWAKLVRLAPHLTPENVDEWVKNAKDVTHATLAGMLKESKANGELPEPSEQSNAISKLSIPVFEDQKENIEAAFEKAQEATNSESKGTQLEAMALDYLAGGPVAPPTAKEQETGPEETDGEALDPKAQLLAIYAKLREEGTYEEALTIAVDAAEEAFPEAFWDVSAYGKTDEMGLDDVG